MSKAAYRHRRLLADSTNSHIGHDRPVSPHIGCPSYPPSVPVLDVCYQAVNLNLPNSALGSKVTGQLVSATGTEVVNLNANRR